MGKPYNFFSSKTSFSLLSFEISNKFFSTITYKLLGILHLASWSLVYDKILDELELSGSSQGHEKSQSYTYFFMKFIVNYSCYFYEFFFITCEMKIPHNVSVFL